jgi:ribosomal protein S15P/S13E
MILDMRRLLRYLKKSRLICRAADRIEQFFVRNHIWLVAINTVGGLAMFLLLLLAVDRDDKRGEALKEQYETLLADDTLQIERLNGLNDKIDYRKHLKDSFTERVLRQMQSDRRQHK